MSRYKLSAIILSLFFLILYGLSATNTPTGIADADELTLAAFFFSPPHPPGFPLFTLIGHASIIFLNFFTNPAHAANLTSALFQTIALTFLFLINHTLITHLAPKRKPSLQTVIAATATLLTGLSYFIWQYATIFEITSFSAMLATISIFLALNWFLNPKPTTLQYLSVWVAVGLLLSHYHLAIVYLPAFLSLLLFKQRFNLKTFAVGIVTLITTFTITSLLLLLLNQQSPFAWSFPQTLAGVFHHLSRQDYVGIDVESNTTYASAFSLPDIFNSVAFDSIGIFFTLMTSQFSLLVIILGLIGVVFLYRHHKPLFWTTSLLFLLSGPFLAAYMHIAGYAFEVNLLLGIAARQFVLAEIAFSLFLVPGILFIMQQRYLPQILTITTISALVVFQFLHNDSLLLNKQDRELNYRYLHQNLQAANPNALIICSTDIDCYGLWYQSLIEHTRPDVTVLSHVPVYRQQLLDTNFSVYPFSLSQNPQYLEFLIANNINYHSIYFTSGVGFYDKYLGMEDGPFFLLPTQNMFLLHTQYPTTTAPALPEFVVNVASHLDPRNLYIRGIIEAIANNQAYAGYLSLKYRQNDTANQFLHIAQTLDPQNQQTLELINNQDAVIQAVAIDDPKMRPKKLIDLGQQAQAAAQTDTADQAFRFAVLLGGNDPKTIQSALDYYHQVGDQITTIYLEELLRYNNQAPE